MNALVRHEPVKMSTLVEMELGISTRPCTHSKAAPEGTTCAP